MSLLRIGCLRSFSTSCNFSAIAQTAAKTVSEVPQYELSEVDNGVRIVACKGSEMKSPIVTLCVAVENAGSRSEGYDNAGVSHAMRLACGLSTKALTTFGITRNLQQMGCSLSCVQTRETIFYNMNINRDLLNEGVDFLVETVVNPAFKPWEVTDYIPKSIKIEMQDKVTPMDLAFEGFHKGSYREGGLGNSLFCPERNIDNINADMLQNFHEAQFKAGNTVFGTYGLDTFTAKKYGNLFVLPKSEDSSPQTPSKFLPGDFRFEMTSPNTYIVIGTEIPSTSPEDRLAKWALQHILGNEIKVKRGSGCGKLQEGVSKTLGSVPHGVSSFLKTYKDSDIMGACLITDSQSASKGIDSVVSTLKNLKVTDQDVKAAKKNIEMDLGSYQEDKNIMLQGITESVTRMGVPMIDYRTLLASLSTADVQNVSKALSSSKLSISSVGNLASVPYSDSLK